MQYLKIIKEYSQMISPCMCGGKVRYNIGTNSSSVISDKLIEIVHWNSLVVFFNIIGLSLGHFKVFNYMLIV